MHLLSVLPTIASTSSGEEAMGGIMLLVMVVFYIAMLAAMVWLYGTIARKAGYSFWYALLLFVPIVNLVFLVLFAVKEWPIEARVRELEHYTGARRYQ